MTFRTERRNNDFDIGILNKLSEDLTNAITNSKSACHRRIASKLNDPNSAPKADRSILKSFVNNKKIPLIPPILVNDQLVTHDLAFETTERNLSFDIFLRSTLPRLFIRSFVPNNGISWRNFHSHVKIICFFNIKAFVLTFKKNTISSWFEIIGPYHYYLYAGKSLRN